MELIHLENAQAFMRNITLRAAEQSEQDGKVEDAMQLYNLAQVLSRVGSTAIHIYLYICICV